ncbi:MAG: hypothetical protein ACTSYR_05295, partial [Candidatus Odinarchaeia archaeon]
FSGLDEVKLNQYSTIWDFYQKHIINLDIIPYHSSSIKLPNKLTSNQKKYLKTRFEANIKFLKKLKNIVRLIIFNGKIFKILLNEKIISPDTKYIIKKKITPKTTMHLFTIRKFPCVLFDYFITQPASQVTNNIISKISKIIKQKFNKKYFQNI